MVSRSGKILYALSGCACIVMVISRIWVAEDAYITFRSIENLYDGLGLVFNPGERIEASTHPLWMMLLILIRGIPIPLHIGSIVLGLFFSITGLFWLFKRDLKYGLPVVITPLLLCSISGFRDFATAGMEYSLVFFLLVLLITSIEKQALKDRVYYHATLLGLLYLTRPELAILWIYYSACFLFEIFGPHFKSGFRAITSRDNLIKCIVWVAGFFSTAGIYHIFRALYYNDIFPNTYYAKAGLSSYYIQGLKYLLYNLIWSPAVLLAGGMIIFILFRAAFRKNRLAKGMWPVARELVAAVLTGFYIVRVGGDFMSFRFLLPEFIIVLIIFTPIVAKYAKYIQNWFHSSMKIPPDAQPWLATIILIALSFWPVPLHKGYIADERRIFTSDGQVSFWKLFQGQDHRWGQQGRRYGLLASCLGPNTLKLTNSMTQANCMEGLGLGYFGVAAGPSVFILDEQALPNRNVANLPVLYRWRPGHEHYLTIDFVIDQKSTFCASGEAQFDQIMSTRYGTMISLDPELLATMPDISNRLKKLLDYKNSVNSPVIPRLEEKWGQTIERLYAQSQHWQSDPALLSNNRCWQPGF